MKNKIRFVKDIQIVKDGTEKDKLAIKARGVAELKMKINPVLIPRDYESEPADGIYELDFTLDETNEAYTNVDLEVEVVIYIRNLPGWVKAIRINASENSDIELL
ncbi:MAG: hypothetical protein M0Q51_09055 [Bacteroidales bacterium]|nr:hypothetical protein [Bacteroidales bacterium]